MNTKIAEFIYLIGAFFTEKEQISIVFHSGFYTDLVIGKDDLFIRLKNEDVSLLVNIEEDTFIFKCPDQWYNKYIWPSAKTDFRANEIIVEGSRKVYSNVDLCAIIYIFEKALIKYLDDTALNRL